MQFIAVENEDRQIPVNLGFAYTADLTSASKEKCHDCEEIWYKFIDSNSKVRCWICFAEQIGPYSCKDCEATGILIRDLHDCRRDNPEGFARMSSKFGVKEVKSTNPGNLFAYAVIDYNSPKLYSMFESDNPALAFRAAVLEANRGNRGE